MSMRIAAEPRPLPPAPLLSPPRAVRWISVAALGSIVLWYLVVNLTLGHVLADEMLHYPMIHALARGEFATRQFPMPTTYHRIAALPVRASLWVAEWSGAMPYTVGLWTARAFQAACGIAVVLLYRALVRRRYPNLGDERLALFVWNPLVFSYFALVYTDIAALLPVLGGIYCHLRGWHVRAALALAAACLIRQSSLLWVAYVAVWRLGEAWPAIATPEREWRPRVAAVARVALAERLWLHALIVLGGAVFLLRWGGLVFSSDEGNQPHFNPAQFYLLGIGLAVLWLPRSAPELVRQMRALPRRPAQALLLIPAAAAVALLATAYRNPNPWNQAFSYIHNYPVRLMADSRAWLLFGCVLITVFVFVFGRLTGRSDARWRIATLAGFMLVFLIPHYPADLRYYLIAVVLLDFLTPYSLREVRALSGWYVLLTLGLCAYIVQRPDIHGGL